MRLKNSSKPLLKQNLSLETPTKLFLSVFLFVYFPLTSTKLPKIPFSLGIPKENRLIFVLSINFWLPEASFDVSLAGVVVCIAAAAIVLSEFPVRWSAPSCFHLPLKAVGSCDFHPDNTADPSAM